MLHLLMGQTKRKVKRDCASCGAEQPPVYGIPDPCLGFLPRVLHACCGHGYRPDAYVVIQKKDGSGTYTLRGDRAREWMRKHGGNPPDAEHDEYGWGRTWIAR